MKQRCVQFYQRSIRKKINEKKLADIKNFEQRADYKQVTCLKADFTDELDQIYNHHNLAGAILKTKIDSETGNIDFEEIDKRVEMYALRTHKLITELERERLDKNDVIDLLVHSERKL